MSHQLSREQDIEKKITKMVKTGRENKYQNKNKVAPSSQTRATFPLIAPCALASWGAQTHITACGYVAEDFLAQTPWASHGYPRGLVGAEECRAMLSLLWKVNSLLTLKWSLTHSTTSWLRSLTWSKMLIMFLFNMIYRTSVTAGES